MNRNLSISLTLVAALLMIVALGFLAGRTFRDPARQAPPEPYTRLEPATPLPELELHDQNSQPFGLKQLAGKWSLVFFGYTHCPDICPTTLVVLRDVERLAGGKNKNTQY
ncbi:MAG: SCO family protein, partial [Gammaproteobacteria bacterium]|nr:SCO family protein [Gammaproteobacteria bacterium]